MTTQKVSYAPKGAGRPWYPVYTFEADLSAPGIPGADQYYAVESGEISMRLNAVTPPIKSRVGIRLWIKHGIRGRNEGWGDS